MGLRSTFKLVKAIQKAEGVGARVRRSIGTSDMTSFNPFLMLDHFNIGADAGFPEHGHSGQETITLVLKGAVAHEDFTGSKGILYPGDLQFMTAGKGVVHSEMPVAIEGEKEISGMQLWVDLPKKLRQTEPRYRDLRSYEIPEVLEQDGKVKVKVISGNSYGVESAHDLAYTPVQYYYVTLKPDGTFTQKVPEDFNFFLYVLEGDDLVVNGDTAVPAHSNIFFKRDGDEIRATNTAKSGGKDIELVLIGGQVLDQESIHYGPFVADSERAIDKAFSDFQYARNGFKQRRTWNSLISNGVTKDMVENQLNGNLEKRKEAEKKFLEERNRKL
ncbi:hypothetical protein CAAN1_15S03774 [[Candida] anglica]|uniref:Pirin n=1 Tax=[Candida] anglica TaxID=148631 RepID=A0ABP0E8B8_9ASCO